METSAASPTKDRRFQPMPPTILQRLIAGLDVLSGGSVSTYFREGVALEGTDEKDADKYRALSTNPARDLKPIEYKRAREMSHFAFQRYPLAGRLIDLMVDFAVGTEVAVRVKIMKRVKDGKDVDTKREDAQKVWDDFSDDPVNRFGEDVEEFFKDALVNGELCIPAFVNQSNGDVRIGYYDPGNIVDVQLDPKNSREADVVVLQHPTESDKKEPKKVVRVSLDPNDKKFFRRMTGEVFYFRLNRVLGATRGYPELLNVVDWIDGLEQFLFDAMEGFAIRNAFMWDVTVKGASEEKLKGMSFDVPRPGGVNKHNEKVEWKAVAPDLKSNEVNDAVRLIKNLILGGKGFPEHWYADGGNTNLATAENMNAPTMQMLKRKQKFVRRFVKTVAQFVLDMKAVYNAEALKLAADEYLDIEVSTFDFERKDAAVVGSAFVQIVTALRVAVSESWITEDDAKKIIDGIVSRFGIEVDTNETVDTIRTKRREKRKEREDEDDRNEADDVYRDKPTDELFGKGKE